MARSRETIMGEWDAVRAKIAGGCTNSGPRDWFDGVMDEQDHIIADLVREIARLQYFEIAELEAAIDHACEVFVEPFGDKNPDKKVCDWRADMMNAMRALRELVPKQSTE